jgi:hypothetical protein
MTGLALDDILAGLTAAERDDLFGGLPAFQKMQEAAKLQGERRRALAASMAALAATGDGMAMLEYLAGAYIRRFDDVTSLGLPMETAIQLHACRDGQRAVVQDLLRLVNEGRQPVKVSE